MSGEINDGWSTLREEFEQAAKEFPDLFHHVVISREWITERTPPKSVCAPSTESNYWSVLSPNAGDSLRTRAIVEGECLEGVFYDRCPEERLLDDDLNADERTRRQRTHAGVVKFDLMVEGAARLVAELLDIPFGLPPDDSDENTVFSDSAIWLGAVYHILWKHPPNVTYFAPRKSVGAHQYSQLSRNVFLTSAYAIDVLNSRHQPNPADEPKAAKLTEFKKGEQPADSKVTDAQFIAAWALFKKTLRQAGMLLRLLRPCFEKESPGTWCQVQNLSEEDYQLARNAASDLESTVQGDWLLELTEHLFEPLLKLSQDAPPECEPLSRHLDKFHSVVVGLVDALDDDMTEGNLEFRLCSRFVNLDRETRVLLDCKTGMASHPTMADVIGVSGTGKSGIEEEKEDALPKKKRKLAPSRIKAKAAYEWAVSKIPGAEDMTIDELYQAIECHPSNASECIGPSAATFGKYLRDAGVKRYATRDNNAAGVFGGAANFSGCPICPVRAPTCPVQSNRTDLVFLTPEFSGVLAHSTCPVCGLKQANVVNRTVRLARRHNSRPDHLTMSHSISPTAHVGDITSNRRLFDVRDFADLCSCSVRHIYRLNDARRCPKNIKLGSLVRWPARTGDPMTGVLDWLEAGCPDCRRATK